MDSRPDRSPEWSVSRECNILTRNEIIVVIRGLNLRNCALVVIGQRSENVYVYRLPLHESAGALLVLTGRAESLWFWYACLIGGRKRKLYCPSPRAVLSLFCGFWLKGLVIRDLKTRDRLMSRPDREQDRPFAIYAFRSWEFASSRPWPTSV